MLSASALAAVLAVGLGWVLLAAVQTRGAARTADEAENSTEL
ncbi:MAG TPA: hypothetical protein VFN67_23740 [Polyangiales bacterium]|nr:hypothetical protein [Polyangiales bacterium]